MTALPTLDPEISDLGLALGLLKPSTSGVELDSDWFSAPGPKLVGTLADDQRRHALVRFVEAVLGQGEHTERDGVTLLHFFGLRELTGDAGKPDLVVQVSLDERPTDYVEVGLAITFATTTPATTTDLLIPLYRATKQGRPKPTQPFALLAGGLVQLASDITLSSVDPPVGDFGLKGVGVSIKTPLDGSAPPAFSLVLKGMHLPGATNSTDLPIGGAGQNIEQTLLSLVLGLVRQSAESLAGPAAAEVNAVLDLLGLGSTSAIPPLPVADVLAHGAGELRNWFTSVMGAAGARDAWLGALAEVVNGTAADGVVTIPIPGGPVSATVALNAAPGPSGHLVVTPRLGVRFTQDVAGAVRLGGEAIADLVTIDTATGHLAAVPRFEVGVTATGSGVGDAAKLLHTGDVAVGALRFGLSIIAGAPHALLELRDVDVESNHHDVIDLSSPDAVVAAAGEIAGDLVGKLIDKLGAAAPDVKGLLGLIPTGSMPALDAAHLLTDPLGTLAGWWHDLTTTHAADVPAVLERLRNLVANAAQVALPVSTADPTIGPWSIPIANKLANTLAIDIALDNGRLVIEPVVSMRVDDLAGGCTVVSTEIRTRLASIDLAARHATFPLSVELNAKLRARGADEARLALGPVAVVADFIGVHAGWNPATGLAVGLQAPNLSIDTGSGLVPLVIPTVDANGHLNVPAAAWSAIESLLGVLAANAPFGWLTDLTDLAGWSLTPPRHGAHLPLADLATDPATALKSWLGSLATDADVLGSLVSTLAHLTGGSPDGLAGVFAGSGTPSDPWLAALTASGSAPALAVWMAPHGPVQPATAVGPALTGWRPKMPGLPPDGLAQALFDEARAGPDVAGLAAGRADIATGLAALVGRWVGTDGLVAPPSAPLAGVTTITREDLDYRGLTGLDIDLLIPGGVPVGAVVVKVAVTPASTPAWAPATGRLLDLTTPGLAPASFTVADPAPGEWVVALATRADATLGGNEDPAGLVGQSRRLQQVLTRLSTAGPVVLVALGGAGHAARIAADAVTGVTHLVTLGTPWSPATFDSARTGAPADALRLMRALLPALDPIEPDDADLTLGRHIVEGFMAAARGNTADLEAPQPSVSTRNGLAAIAVFGVLGADTVARAMTAVFAAGLSLRAQTRVTTALAKPTSAVAAIRVPFSLVTPPGGHGITVQGSIALTLGDVEVATAAITARPGIVVELHVADTDSWLLGGPGTSAAGGALPLELRRISARVEIGGPGGHATAGVTLHEGAALGADFASLVVVPPTGPTGTLEIQPLLPEAQALLSALTTKLASVGAGSPADRLAQLLQAVGITQADGGLVPDALTHLLHEPAAQLRTILAGVTTRPQLLDALAGLVAGLTVVGDTVHLATGPLTADADVAAGTIGFSATGGEGLLAWTAGLQFPATGRPIGSIVVGDPATDAFALRITGGHAELVRPGPAAPIGLYPTPDLDGLAKLALAAIPAEAIRVLLEALRRIDTGLGTALEDLAGALGMLKPIDANGRRAYATPVGLFENPVGWFKAEVLTLTNGGPFDADRIITLLDGLKPFLGLTGTPRGVWPIADGITVIGLPTSDGPNISLAIDATSWLAGLANRAPVAAGITVGLTLPAGGAPKPTIEVFVGVPDGANGTSTPQHRQTAHLAITGNQARVFLRPATGADIELFPNVSGLGSLLTNGVTAVLPLALTQLAAMSGDAVRTEVASLVGEVGRALALATGTPAVFDAVPLKALAADPPSYLRARLGTLLTQVVTPLNALLARLLGGGPPAISSGGSGAITVTVKTVVVEIHPSPFSVSVTGVVSGLPIVGAAEASLAVGDSGVTGWSFGAGPAAIDLGGPMLRPFARVSSNAGWQVETGLGLDALAPTATNHRELTARWRKSSGLGVLVTTRTGPTAVAEDNSDGAVATAAIDAVIDLVGGWVLGVTEVKTLLAKPVGSKTVKFVVEGSILTSDPTPTLLPGPLTGWPGKLLTIAGQLAAAAPSVPVGPFTLSIASSGGGVFGIALSMPDGAGIELTSGGETSLKLEVDASWIDPPSTSGIVIDLLKINGPNIEPAPGIEVNGVGLRIGKTTGPLIDAGLKLDSVAVHLFGSLRLGGGGVPQFGGGVQVELGGLAVPLGGGGDNAVAKGIMRDAGGSGAPPRPAFSPALAVQDHGQGVAVSLRAGSGDGPWFLPIQRAFGPVYLEQVGLGVDYRQNVTPRQLEMISVYLDGSVSLIGLTAAVEKLRIGYHVTRPFFSSDAWEVDVEGFAISATFGPLSLAGGLAKFPLDAPLTGVEYLGMLKIRYSVYGIDLFGGYAHPTEPNGESFASFFAFGVLHAPLGGVPAFFVTGIGIGFGINRELHTPSIDQVTTHPFMQALRAFGPTPEPMQQLKDMRAIVPPAQGEFWVAAGISFTSFVLITGEILVTVQFGDGLEIAVLGVARAELPTPVLTLVSIELALLARFSTKEGLLLVQAQLTENSWLLTKSVRLTGGFAFATWWKGPNAGQFVVTVGGYHPRFHHDGYPVVPRVGLKWQPADFVSIEGGVYFALCSEAIMAGAGIHAAAHLGPAHASLDLGFDGIVFFDPFFFSVRVYAEARVGITIWLLFGSVDIDVSLGFDVTVEGPPIHLFGHFSVCGIGIPFEIGQGSDPADKALHAGEFADKYLRGDKQAQVVQAAIIRGALTAGKSDSPNSGGVAKPPDGSAEHPFRVVPEFQMSFVTIAPSTHLELACAAGTIPQDLVDPGLGVAPMYSATLESALMITLTSDDAQTFDLADVHLTLRPAAAFPKGVWAPAGNPKAKTVPSGDTVNACDGFTVDTLLDESKFVGAPDIDYHQVELPLTGRKPLPFITNRANTDGRVIAAKALRDAAKVLVAGNPDADLRFVRTALVLSAAGRGLTSVAALRGERNAAPSFGSLADDLVVSPDAVSTPVTPVVVDRNPPPPRRFAPLVKSVVGVPMALTLDRPTGTTVADPGRAVTRVVPRLADVQSAHAGSTQLALHVIPRSAQRVGGSLSAVGAAPLTRLASGTVGAVANAQPGTAAGRLAGMTAGLVGVAPTGSGPKRRVGKGASGGATVQEGELAVITIANRPRGEILDTVTIAGGLTRVLSMAAGGLVLDDQIVGSDGQDALVTLPRPTERVAIVAIGASAGAGGSVAGWYAGQSLPTVGWGAAIGGGVVVTGQGHRVGDNRERADGGWVNGHELTAAARVVTVFTDDVNAIAVVIDDRAGADAAAKVSMTLADATRSLDASGVPQPPQVLVEGVRTILLYAVQTTGPNPRVFVEGGTSGELAGVLGGSNGVAALANALAAYGVAAAVPQPLVGGPGRRLVTMTIGDDVPPPTPVPATPAKKAAAKKRAAGVAKKASATKKAPAQRRTKGSGR